MGVILEEEFLAVIWIDIFHQLVIWVGPQKAKTHVSVLLRL